MPVTENGHTNSSVAPKRDSAPRPRANDPAFSYHSNAGRAPRAANDHALSPHLTAAACVWKVAMGWSAWSSTIKSWIGLPCGFALGLGSTNTIAILFSIYVTLVSIAISDDAIQSLGLLLHVFKGPHRSHDGAAHIGFRNEQRVGRNGQRPRLARRDDDVDGRPPVAHARRKLEAVH